MPTIDADLAPAAIAPDPALERAQRRPQRNLRILLVLALVVLGYLFYLVVLDSGENYTHVQPPRCYADDVGNVVCASP
jgi:hypothetical protein